MGHFSQENPLNVGFLPLRFHSLHPCVVDPEPYGRIRQGNRLGHRHDVDAGYVWTMQWRIVRASSPVAKGGAPEMLVTV